MLGKAFGLVFFLFIIIAPVARGQKGYEFEVYETKIAPRNGGGIELHTNFVALSARDANASAAPLRRAFRSAVEVSTGLTSWLEGSLYAVGYARSGRGIQYVGNRARLESPKEWPRRYSNQMAVSVVRCAARGARRDRIGPSFFSLVRMP